MDSLSSGFMSGSFMSAGSYNYSDDNGNDVATQPTDKQDQMIPEVHTYVAIFEYLIIIIAAVSYKCGLFFIRVACHKLASCLVS